MSATHLMVSAWERFMKLNSSTRIWERFLENLTLGLNIFLQPTRTSKDTLVNPPIKTVNYIMGCLNAIITNTLGQGHHGFRYV